MNSPQRSDRTPTVEHDEPRPQSTHATVPLKLAELLERLDGDDDSALAAAEPAIEHLLDARAVRLFALSTFAAACWPYLWFAWCMHWTFLAQSPESAAPVAAVDLLIAWSVRDARDAHKRSEADGDPEPV
jgi:hypothetical protein